MTTTRTHFTFRVDTWTPDGESIVEHMWPVSRTTRLNSPPIVPPATVIEDRQRQANAKDKTLIRRDDLQSMSISDDPDNQNQVTEPQIALLMRASRT